MGLDTFLAGSVSAGPLRFSNAGFLGCDGESSSLLALCDAAPLSIELRFSAPDCEPGEPRFEASGRALPVVRDSRLLAVLAVVVGREAPADETDAWRPTRDAGTAGGPIDDLVVAEAARALVVVVPRAFAGVPVREVAALDEAVPSCFVGDLVGDLAMLEGRDVLGPGLGLGAFRLFLLPTPVSREALAVLDPEVNMLLGLEVLVFLVAVGAGFGFGGGWAITATAAGRTNMPLPMSQSKYRSPWTLPSFLPEPSSSSTPTQTPGAKAVSPTKRTTALRPSARRMTCPGISSVILTGGRCSS